MEQTEEMKTIRECIAEWLATKPTKLDYSKKEVPCTEGDFFDRFKRVTLRSRYNTSYWVDKREQDWYRVTNNILEFLQDCPCVLIEFEAEPEKSAATYLDVYYPDCEDKKHRETVSGPATTVFWALMDYFHDSQRVNTVFREAIYHARDARDYQKKLQDRIAEIKAQERREALHAKGMLDEDEIAEIVTDALDDTIEYEGTIGGGTNPENEWEADATFTSDLDDVSVRFDEETGCFSVEVSYSTPSCSIQTSRDDWTDIDDEDVSFGGEWDDGQFEEGADPTQVVEGLADKIKADIDEQVKKA